MLQCVIGRAYLYNIRLAFPAMDGLIMGFLDALFKPKDQSDEDAERSALIMRRLKSRHDSETGKWLALMQDPNETPPPRGPAPTLVSLDRREVVNDAPYVPPMEAQYTSLAVEGNAQAVAHGNETVEWVNSLFAEFDRQSRTFNSTAEGTHLVMTVHPPSYTFESSSTIDKYDPYKKISIFKGHVSTLYWAMLVQGYESKIDVYIISADEILNFTINDIRQSQVSPFLSLQSSKVDGRRIWNFGETTITAQTIPLLSKELLGDLVRVAAGTMSEDELFTDHQTELKLGETVAQGFDPLKATQSLPALPQPGAAKATAHVLQPKEKTPQEVVDGLISWKACAALTDAINQDLSTLVSRAGSLDPANDKEALDKLQDVATSLRELSGHVGTAVAEHRPSKGSKYNPS